MSGAEADRWAWLLVLSFVFGCNVLRILLPSFSSFVSGCLAFPGPVGGRRGPRRSGVRLQKCPVGPFYFKIFLFLLIASIQKLQSFTPHIRTSRF